MRRIAPVICALVLLTMARGDAPVKPPAARDYASPGGVGPSRGWYVWKKFDPDTWQVEVTRDPPGETTVDSWSGRFRARDRQATHGRPRCEPLV